MRITSLSNPRIKQLVRLASDSSQRRASGLFCVESRRELERALAAGLELIEVFVCPTVLRGLLDAEHVTEISEPVLRKVAYREKPEGLIAVLRAPVRRLEDLAWNGRELLLVCSGVEKPGNIGAMLRSADAAGATAVLIDSPDFDLYNPNCIRASTGAVFSTRVICAERESIRQSLREHGVKILAATPEAPAGYTEADLSGAVALVLGAEATGLAADWREAADLSVSIPQGGAVDSLNVSVTAALLMFEAVRQRSSGG